MRVLLPVALLCAWPLTAAAAGWRGDGTGRYPDATPPLRWSETENVAWKTGLPAWGNSTPIVIGEQVCLTAEPTTVLCLRKSDGKALWSRALSWLDTVPAAERAKGERAIAEAQELAARVGTARAELEALRRRLRKKGATPESRARLESLTAEYDALQVRLEESAHLRAPLELPVVGYASATPASDGATIVAAFGTGVVAALSLDGKLRWARHLPWTDKAMHGYPNGTAASLVIAGGVVVVPLGRLYGLELATGKTRWEGPDYKDFGTPALARVGAEDVVLTPSGAAIRASDGKVLGEKLAWTLYIGAQVDARRVLVAGNVKTLAPDPAQATLYGLPASAEPFALTRLWQVPLPNGRWNASPLVDGELVTMVHEDGRLVVLGLARGETLVDRRLNLEGHVFPSPARAGRHVFVSDDDGTTVVLEAKAPFTEVARNRIEPFRASLVFEGRRLFVRSMSSLYCLEAR
jgi:outer membrane protein assembly factor BamB